MYRAERKSLRSRTGIDTFIHLKGCKRTYGLTTQRFIHNCTAENPTLRLAGYKTAKKLGGRTVEFLVMVTKIEQTSLDTVVGKMLLKTHFLFCYCSSFMNYYQTKSILFFHTCRR